MKFLLKYSALLLLFVISSCGDSGNNTSSVEMQDMSISKAVNPSQTQGSSSEIPERKLIQEGRIEFETDQFSTARNYIVESVEKFGGYISSDQEFNYPTRKSNTLVVRIPSESFDNFLNEATKEVETFDRKEINLKDVTEEFLDIETRLTTMKELEARYLELLEQASTVSEILEIEREIGRQRSEIESIEGRLKYLQSQVSYSTLRITLYTTFSTQNGFFQQLKSSFYNGWDNLISFIIYSINLWPFILIGIALIFGLKSYKSKKKKPISKSSI